MSCANFSDFVAGRMMTYQDDLADASGCYTVAIDAMRNGLTVIDGHHVHHGDCLSVMRVLELGGIQVDSIVTDPPYHLTSIVQRFGGDNAAPTRATDAYKRAAAGFMNQKWDGGDIAFQVDTWRKCFNLLKPGGHLLAFCGTRTYHRMACAIEDAGFEIRDCKAWHYGNGFPKSMDIGKAIDKTAGAARQVVGQRIADDIRGGNLINQEQKTHTINITAPATPEARQWEGWGTALKPATELICFARKPLSEKTVAANVLKHGTGGINIDGCRVGTDDNLNGGAYCGGMKSPGAATSYFTGTHAGQYQQPAGRFPANLIHDGSPEVLAGFPETGDESAARFFYQAKADKSDRVFHCRACGARWHGESKCCDKPDVRSHPTVKPVDLLQHLVRMVTPPGGTVLDPFAGTGTTGAACIREGFKSILIEQDADHAGDIVFRMQTRSPAAPKGGTAPPGRQQCLF